MQVTKLSNPSCQRDGYCLESCQCCEIKIISNRLKRLVFEKPRPINENSLFGFCRRNNKCYCGDCKTIALETLKGREMIRKATERKMQCATA